MPAKGIIIWRGDLGSPESHYSKSQVPDVTDDSALATLITSLGAYSDCNVAKRSYITMTLGTDSEPGVDANVDRKAVVYFRHPTTLKVHSITIPAPKSTAVVDEPAGERVTAAAMTAIVNAIVTATGVSYTPLYGVVIQKR